MRNYAEKTYLQKAIYICGKREVKPFIVGKKNRRNRANNKNLHCLRPLVRQKNKNSLCSVAQKQNKTEQPQDLYKHSTREREREKNKTNSTSETHN